jgi:hypothetical protein
MSIKLTKKEFSLFLEDVSSLLSEEVNEGDINQIQKSILNLRFIADKTTFLKSFVKGFENNALNDLKNIRKAPNATPEEVQQLKKLVDNYISVVALTFDKGLVDKLPQSDGSVKDALGPQAGEALGAMAAKLNRYAEVISAGAIRVAPRIQSIKVNPANYSISPAATKSIVSDVSNLSVNDFKESYQDAFSHLQDVGLRPGALPPSSIPPPPPKSIPPTEPAGQTKQDIETSKTMLFNPSQATNAMADIVDFWNKLTPNQKSTLPGLKQILDKHKIVS